MKYPKLFSLFILFFSVINAAKINAQPSCIWAKGSAGDHEDYSSSVATDALGNIYVAGYFRSTAITFGSTTLSNALPVFNTADVFLVKYDPSGNVLWAKSFGDSLDDKVYSMKVDNFGNIYMTGNFESRTMSFGSTILSNISGKDIFLVKLNSAGNVVWARSTGGSTTSSTNRSVGGLTTDMAGNVFVTGCFDSSIIFGAIHLTGPPSGGTDVFIVKYDSAGSAIWAQKNTAGWAESNSIAVDGSGNIYITGTTSGTLSFGTATLNNTVQTIFFAKFNSSGNVVWMQGINDSDYFANEGSQVSTDASGYVYLTGMFTAQSISIGSTTLSNSGSDADIFLAKYDAGGNVIWAKSAGSNSQDAPFSIINDAAGNILISGYYNGSSITFGSTTLTNNLGMFIAKYNSSGSAIWAKGASNSTSFSWATSIAEDVSGNLYATGVYGLNFSLDAVTLVDSNTPYTDVFLAKFDPTNGVQETSINRNDIVLYPNPVKNEINIKASENIKQLTISNILGQIVYSREYDSEKVAVDVRELPAGIYLVKINNLEIRKFVKQ